MTNLYDNSDFIFSVSIKILFLFTFLTCFFYIILEKQISDGLSNSIANIVTDNFDFNILSKLYNNSTLSKSEYHTKESILYNNIVYMLNIFIIVFLLCSSIIIYYTSNVFCKRKISLKQIIIFNLILYVLVGIIEYSFFIYIAKQYIPITNGEIIKNLQSYFNK